MSTNKPIVGGHIRFGIVVIPIRVFTAQDSQDIKTHRYHRGCGEPVGNRGWCEVHGQVVTGDVYRGYEYIKGGKGVKAQHVELTDAELEPDAAEDGRPIDIKRFVGADELDSVYYEKTYWIAPDDVGRVPFQLLREAMEKEGKVALGTFILKTKENPVILRPITTSPNQGLIAMVQLLRTDEIRDPAGLAVEGEVDPALLKATRQLVQAMTGPADLEEFKDGRRERILKIVDAKVQGQPVPTEAKAAKAKAPADLMEALRESMKVAATPKKAKK